jgi:serine/threonine protein kinase
MRSAHESGKTPVATPIPPPVPVLPSADNTVIAYRPLKTFQPNINRSRVYSFALDAEGNPIELGSGRFAKAYLGEERWLESKTAFARKVAIKVLQRGVKEEDALRFEMEKELLERVQGHPNVIYLYASGESDNPEFIPAPIRDKVENDFMVVELMEMSLEEFLKGSRSRGRHENLLAYTFRERLFRVLEYMLPIASAVEYTHLVRNICHRDIKPANILLRLPDRRLQGATLDVRLADFNVGKVKEEQLDLSMTQYQSVPGTLFFQAPEQETNVLELLVNVHQGSMEVDFFEDFYMSISENDVFQLYNRRQRYPVMGADRQRKKLLLGTPFQEQSEVNVRAKIIKSVDRPADVYSLGALFYYLISGAYSNPKSLYDAFHNFIEYEREDEQNTVGAFIDHEYQVISSIRAPKVEGEKPKLAPADRFFSYKQYLDGNGELLDKDVMRIVAKAMIRNKPDSYCQAWDVNTTGISELVADLIRLYGEYGVDASARPAYLGRFNNATFSRSRVRHAWARFLALLRGGTATKPRPPWLLGERRRPSSGLGQAPK